MRHLTWPRRSQRGAAAVELAFALPIFLVVLTFPLLLGRCLWHYTAAQKAAHDAARYLSSASAQEMREPALALAAADTVTVSVSINLYDPVFGLVIGRHGLPIGAKYEMRYLGR